MNESRMTLRVYQVGSDGVMTELGSDEIIAWEFEGSRFVPESPCRCPRCCASEDGQGKAAGGVA
jgi:hypothetical protein